MAYLCDEMLKETAKLEKAQFTGESSSTQFKLCTVGT